MSLAVRVAACLAVAVVVLAAGAAPAGEFYASPTGKVDAAGTQAAPWDLASALDGKQKAVRPGDTIYLLDGTYKGDRKKFGAVFDVRLTGTDGAPVTVRPAPGSHAVIDGGLMVQDPSAHVWIRGLEVLVSEPLPAKPVPPGSNPEQDADGNPLRPHGGLHLMAGRNCKLINLVIHDTMQGISAWTPAVDAEIYGCVIYDNGWEGTDRGHGHGIYTQNKDGTKTIANCLFTGGHGWSMHAYGSKNAYVDNFLIEGNIAYRTRYTFLVGGGRPSRGIQVLRNYLYDTALQVGYTAPENEDCVVRDNVIVNGGLSINKFKQAVNENNRILIQGRARTPEVIVALLPNKYDPNRAHLFVADLSAPPAEKVEPAPAPATKPAGDAGNNAATAPPPTSKPAGKVRTLPVKVDKFLADGDEYRLMDPRGLFGKPVATGTCQGGAIPVPLTDGSGCFVVLKGKL